MEKKLEIQAKKYRGESSVVSARMPIELVKVLDNVAEQTGRTRNEIMIMCLEFALNNIVISDSDGEN
ncbi:MAG: hypothetical protein J1F32_04650 [Erysipelotrichales bacterium]|nr:hypothetical protein [Erysipelotrichales bacterium]